MASKNFTFKTNLSKILLTKPSDSSDHFTVTSCQVNNACDQANNCKLVLNYGEPLLPKIITEKDLVANEQVEFMIDPKTISIEPNFSLEFICTQPETKVSLKWM
tara:strand:+ start:15553 stop:15864 length:312 start_codon:yes stop_codon:yes gene_type:complete